MASKYRIGKVDVDSSAPAFAEALKGAFANKHRPLCLCKPDGVEMYVARFADRHLVKRMPGSAASHDADCESYQPPPEVSGLGELDGAAIQEDVATGTTILKLDFSLTKVTGRAAPSAGSNDGDSVRTDGSKLTLRGLLHYLWGEAELTKWVPGMAGKRSWGLVRRLLLQAALNKMPSKSYNLCEVLYVPEVFMLEHKDVIVARRAERLAKVMSAPAGVRKLLVLVGEVKDFVPGRFNMKAVIKHLPDMHLQVPEDLMRRLQKRFSTELEIWRSYESTHLMTVATFSVSQAGITTIEEMALMTVNSEWLPIENAFELQLLDELHRGHRRFTKCLRYNLVESKPLATAVLTDTRPEPVAMYVLPHLTDAVVEGMTSLILSSQLTSWAWRPMREGMPALPPAGLYEVSSQEVVDRMVGSLLEGDEVEAA